MALKRDFMLVSGGRLATALVALITIRAVTTFLTPEQYGELALFIAVQMFCGLFLVNPVGQHINLHTHAWWDDGTLMARLSSYQKYILAVSLVGFVVVLGMNKQDSNAHLLIAAVAMFAMIVAGTWNATLIPMLNMLGFRAASVMWSVITVVSGLAGSILFVERWPSATAWFAGQAIGMAVGALGAKYEFWRHAAQPDVFRNSPALIDRRTVIGYCLPLALATGLMWLQISGYRFFVETYWGLAQLGFMAVGLQLAGQIWALVESLSVQFFYPLFYRRVSAHEKLDEVESAFSDLLNSLVPVYFVLTGVIVLSAPYLLKVLVAPQFQDAITFTMLGAGIELCRVLGNLLSNAAHVRRKTKSLALPYAVGSVVTLALIFLVGGLRFEMIWVGAALVLGAMTMFLVMLVSMYRQVKFVLDVWRTSVGVAVMLAMVLLAYWMPTVHGLGEVIVALALVAAFSGVIVFVLLWKNPAILQLLNVRLRND